MMWAEHQLFHILNHVGCFALTHATFSTAGLMYHHGVWMWTIVQLGNIIFFSIGIKWSLCHAL